MSRLDELIAELCPNGVEYRTLGDCAEYVRGVVYNKSAEINDNSEGYKILRANNISLNTNTLNFDDVKVISKSVKVSPRQMLSKDDILICAGSGSKEHIGKVAYIESDMDYTFGGFMGVVRCNKLIHSKYLFHMLTGCLFKQHLEKTLNSSTINNLNSSVMNSFKIPVPPLPVQEEIVRILDNFAELTAELTAELSKRKQQYQYYRDMLLTFNDIKATSQTDRQTDSDKQCRLETDNRYL